MTEEEFHYKIAEYLYDDADVDDDAYAAGRGVYGMVLRYIVNDVIDPRDSTRGVIFALKKRLKELENS